MKVYLHSYTFRAHPFETAVQYARRYAYDGLELSLVHCRDTHMESDLDAYIKTSNRYGMRIGCVDFRGNFIADSERDVYQSVSLLEKKIGLCAARDIRLLNGYVGILTKEGEPFSQSGSAIAKPEHYQRAADSLRYLGNIALEKDVILTLEIHMSTPHDTIASALQLLKQIDHERVRVNPDPANVFATTTRERGPDMLAPIARWISYFHFKNCVYRAGQYDYSVSLSGGEIDTFGYIRKLRDLEFTGPVCIEYVGEGDPRVAAKSDIAYLRECIQLLDDGLC